MIESVVPDGAERDQRVADHGIDDAHRATFWDLMHGDAIWRAAVHDFMTLDCLLPEDWPSVAPAACAAASAVLGTQARFRSVQEDQLVKADVSDVSEHIRQALALEHPLEHVSPLYKADRRYERKRDAELRAAVRQTVADGHNGPARTSRRVGCTKYWSALLRSLSHGARVRLAPPHVLACPLPPSHPAFVAAIVVAIDHWDKDLPLRMIMGCPPTGDLPATNAWDHADVPRSIGLHFDDLPHEPWNRWLAADAERRYAALGSTGREDHEAMWKKSIAERDAGYCEGPFSYEQMDAMFGPGRWRASRRFAVWQKGRLRVIDDDAENLTNAATSQHDKLRTQRADFPARVAVLYSERIGKDVRTWSCEHGTDDVTAFYRIIINGNRAYMVVAIVDPSSGRTVYLVLWGFTFGKVAAVLYSNAVGALGASAARRLLGVPTDHYFDDFDTVPLTVLGGKVIVDAGTCVQGAVGSLMSEMGYGFSFEKHSPSAAKNTFGGVETDFADIMSRGVVRMEVSEGRKRSISSLCEEALVRCPPSSASKLNGKLIFLSCWSAARAMRAATQPLRRRIYAPTDTDFVSQPLRASLEFLRDVSAAAPPHVIRLGSIGTPPNIVYSDAMSDPNSIPEDGGGFVIIERPADGPPVVYVGGGPTPHDVRQHFEPGRKQYIGQFEAVWAHSPYKTVPHVFRNSSTIHFIDNTCSLSVMIKGCAALTDMSKLSLAQSALCVSLSCAPYYFYVRSSANIADYPSRFDLRALILALRAVNLDRFVVWCTPSMPNIASWRLAASAMLRLLGVPRAPLPTLAVARGRWRHLVLDVRTVPSWRESGAIYCGRSRDIGPRGFGNLAEGGRPSRVRGAALVAEHERCVLVYARWLGAPERLELRLRIRRNLRGRRLACHCAGRGLPCHAEVLAAWANDSCLPCSALVHA